MSVQLQLFANNASTTLSIPIQVTDVQLTVANASAFPSPDTSLNQYFLITLESSGIIEVLKVSSRTGNVFTISGGLSGRAQEGTSANAFPAGTKVECRVTEGTLSSFLPRDSYLPYIPTTTLAIPTTMTSTAFMAGVDDGGAAVLAYATSNTSWSFQGYTTTYVGNAASGTQTSVTGTSLPTSGVTGRYIIQFTSGSNQGYCRPINGYGSGSVSWSTPLPYSVTTDGYIIYQSNYSIIQAASSLSDDSLINAIVFG